MQSSREISGVQTALYHIRLAFTLLRIMDSRGRLRVSVRLHRITKRKAASGCKKIYIFFQQNGNLQKLNKPPLIVNYSTVTQSCTDIRRDLTKM